MGDRAPRTNHHELTGGRDMHQILLRSATDAAQTLSRKELSSRELTGMLLARIDAVNPGLNAVVELRREAALRKAGAADEATARGDDTGRCTAIPVTIKDSFNVAGLHTTWGNPAFKDFVADSDATVARRLEQAGAIIVGKTNLPFMLADFGQTANELYGVTNNPWDPARHAGRLQRRSGRGPVRRDDVPRIRIGPGGLHSHPGELLRCLRTEAECRDRPVDRVPATRSPSGSERHAVHVRGGPARPVRTRPEDGAARHRRARGPGGEGLLLQLFFAFQQPGEAFATLAEVVDHENRRMAARAAWSRYFNDVDVFLCPANFTPAFPHDTRPFGQRTITTPEGERPYDNQAFWVSHASLPGLPALAAPIGRTPSGLPVGAQILGPLYEDDTAITFAELLGEVIGGYEPPPV